MEVSNKPSDERDKWRWRSKGERKAEKDETGDGKKEKEKLSIMIKKKKTEGDVITILYELGCKDNKDTNDGDKCKRKK